VPKRNAGLISGNPAITNWFFNDEKSYDSLLAKTPDQKIVEKVEDADKVTCNYRMRVAYQIPVVAGNATTSTECLPRTFEDSFIYSNLDIFANLTDADSEGWLPKVKSVAFSTNIEEEIFEILQKSGFKAGFALDVIYNMDMKTLKVPNYIDEGLRWIEKELSTISRENVHA
jgi:hypothetical protein